MTALVPSAPTWLLGEPAQDDLRLDHAVVVVRRLHDARASAVHHGVVAPGAPSDLIAAARDGEPYNCQRLPGFHAASIAGYCAMLHASAIWADTKLGRLGGRTARWGSRGARERSSQALAFAMAHLRTTLLTALSLAIVGLLGCKASSVADNNCPDGVPCGCECSPGNDGGVCVCEHFSMPMCSSTVGVSPSCGAVSQCMECTEGAGAICTCSDATVIRHGDASTPWLCVGTEQTCTGGVP
jgi:hypothetical protein